MTTRIPTTGDCQQILPRSRTVSERQSSTKGTDGGIPLPYPDFVLTLWTDDPVLAAAADAAGVDRIGLDLERFGKAERQRGLATWISAHRVERLATIGQTLTSAKLFARTNPLGAHTPDEVENLLAEGVEVLMLPMFETAEEVASFISLVAGRAIVVPLLETRAAAESVAELALVEGIEEVHVGLNDLALSLGTGNRFEVLSSTLLTRVSQSARAAGLRLGIGALGRVTDTTLPISPDLLYARYVDLGATAALLARSFVRDLGRLERLSAEVAYSRARIAWWHAVGPPARARAHRRLQAAVASAGQW